MQQEHPGFRVGCPPARTVTAHTVSGLDYAINSLIRQQDLGSGFFLLLLGMCLRNLSRVFLITRFITGDILLNVNGIDLTGVSRTDAVALLKNTSSSVVLKALEMRACDGQEESGRRLPPEAAESSEWSPSWVMWLGLPR